MNILQGFGLPTEKPVVTVFQPFFIHFNLPIQIKRGEIVKGDFIFYNFLNVTQLTKIVLKRDSRFELLNPEASNWKSKTAIKSLEFLNYCLFLSFFR
jgi:hypothetical protein